VLLVEMGYKQEKEAFLGSSCSWASRSVSSRMERARQRKKEYKMEAKRESEGGSNHNFKTYFEFDKHLKYFIYFTGFVLGFIFKRNHKGGLI
jgi:hypothetical protein